jgi:adenosylcobinamide-GDP ribazoletransferase
VIRALAASFGLLTAARVGRAGAPRWAVLGLAPLVGVGLGVLAAAVLAAGHWAFPGPVGGLLAALLAVGSLAWATRGLHLDGLADTADGLGRLGGAAASLAVMRRGDVGPFGVVALVVVAGVQVSALARDTALGRGPASLLLAVVCGRLAMLCAGVRAPAARPDGLGAAVARSVPGWWAGVTAAVVIGLAAGVPAGLGSAGLGARLAGGCAAGLVAGWLVQRRAVRRLGGITGDVLGAVCEVSTAVALVVTALR